MTWNNSQDGGHALVNCIRGYPIEINDQYADDELEHYFVDPEGLNLMNPFAASNDQTHAEDPEPPPGPFDPG